MATDMVGKLDCPSDKQVFADALNVKGWAHSEADGDIDISIFIDGELAKSGAREFPRYDVYQQYLSEAAYLSGFIARIGIADLCYGQHTLEVVARNGNGSHSIGKVDFYREPKNKTEKNFLSKLFSRKEQDRAPLLGGAGSVMRGQRKVAENLVRRFIELGRLKENDRILDVGCGVGRVALPLTQYIGPAGMYVGTDNVRESIEYARAHISPRFPNFQFQHSDVRSDVYNPGGKFKASEYRFDLDDDSFDFVFLTSVFTHMKLDGVKNYLSEVARVLSEGGRCFITYFILNGTTVGQINSGASRRTFRHEFDGYFSDVGHFPERAIAYQESVLRKLYGAVGLTIEEPIYLGSWSGLKGFAGQDIIVALKQ